MTANAKTSFLNVDDIDVFDSPVIIGYPLGAGGNRLRRLLLGRPWSIEPNRDLHRFYEVRKYTIDHGYPKFPDHSTFDVESPDLSKLPVLITHGMDSRVLRRVFPNRKIVKIYCDLYLSLRRHWVVYGRKRAQQDRTNLSLEDQIRFNLDYYRDNIDYEHDHAVYIAPGRGEFEDFMSREFQEAQDPEFDQAWTAVSLDPAYTQLTQLSLLQNSGFSAGKP